MESGIRILLKTAALLVLLLTPVMPGAAQGQQQEPPPPAVDAAIRALNQVNPGIGQPQSFTYTFLPPTTDSSLGCPLIEGYDLGYQTVPYRIMLDYGDSQYTYHASQDASILFPCDPQLPIGGPQPPGSQPFSPDTPVPHVISTFLRSFPERAFPERFEFTFSTPTRDSSLACPLVDGFQLDRPVLPYRVTLIYEDTQYTYHASQDASIIFPCDPQLPIGGPQDPDRRSFTPDSPAQAAINAHLAANPQHRFPQRYEFTIAPPTTDGALGCPLTERQPLPTPTTPNIVTLYDNGATYTYHVSQDASIVIPCTPTSP